MNPATFKAALADAARGHSAEDHVLVLLQLDEGTNGEAPVRPSEAEALVPQLAELVRDEDLIARTGPGRYAMLLYDRTIAQVSRTIAAIDFLRGQLCLPGHEDATSGPTRIGTTFLKDGDIPDAAIGRAASKLERFAA